MDSLFTVLSLPVGASMQWKTPEVEEMLRDLKVSPNKE
jgi:hypothetical protein